MRAARLIRMVLLLQSRSEMTAAELAAELEVSERTVSRDVLALSEAGVPVYADRGRAGGYRLVGGYRTRLTGLGRTEAEALFLSGVPTALRGMGLADVGLAARLKVSAALRPDLSDAQDSVTQRFHLDAPGWWNAPETPELLPVLADAVWNDRRVTAHYRRRDRDAVRLLDSAVSSMVSDARPTSLVRVRVVRPVTYTVAPARPSSTAMARPAPRVAPATSATLPLNSFTFGHLSARMPARRSHRYRTPHVRIRGRGGSGVRGPFRRRSAPAAPSTRTVSGSASPAPAKHGTALDSLLTDRYRVPQQADEDTGRRIMPDGTAAEVFTPLGEDDPVAVAGYRLVARLGAGGMGKVYLSYTPGGRPVAIKVIRPEMGEDPEFRRRFQQEVRAAERVQGLYTAPVIDSDTVGPRPWLATAYVPGPSAAEAVTRHGRLPAPTVLFLVAGAAEALQVIHKAGIVHRDLKPSNVLLADDGPRVIDFGIARAADATSLTGSGVTVGTPSFMAPEQAQGERVTAATDIFALGQIAAYTALGTPAFGEGSSHGVLYRIVHAEPVLDGIPDELRELTTRCLAKNPEDRPELDEILSMCRTASGDTQLRRPGDWLPAGVTADITRRAAAPALPATPPPTEVVDQQGPTQTAGHHRIPGQQPSPQPAGPGIPPSAPHLGDASTMTAHPMGAVHSTAPPGGPYVTAGHYAPHPAGPSSPYGPGHPGPARARTRGATIAAVAVVALFFFFIVLASALSDPDSGSGGTSAGAGDRKERQQPARPDPEPVTYKGVDLAEGYFLVMADDPLRPHDGGQDYESPAELRYTDRSVTHDDRLSTDSTDGDLVLLNNAQKGSLETCRTETRFAEAIELSQLSPGSQLCIRTSSGHVALVTYRGRSPEGDPSDYVTLDVTVWRNAIEPKE